MRRDIHFWNTAQETFPKVDDCHPHRPVPNFCTTTSIFRSGAENLPDAMLVAGHGATIVLGAGHTFRLEKEVEVDKELIVVKGEGKGNVRIRIAYGMTAFRWDFTNLISFHFGLHAQWFQASLQALSLGRSNWIFGLTPKCVR